MLDTLIAFRGIVSNIIGVAVWAGVAFGTGWPLWVSIPVGLVFALVAALLWGIVIGQVMAHREGA